jgi:hypothetical protein
VGEQPPHGAALVAGCAAGAGSLGEVAQGQPVRCRHPQLGQRPGKYFSVSDTSAPTRVARLMLWISSTRTRSTLVRAAVAQTALVTSVRLAERGAGSPKNRANSTATIRGVAAGGTVM